MSSYTIAGVSDVPQQIKSNYSGQYIVATLYDDTLWYSHDHGTTFTKDLSSNVITNIGGPNAIACDASGLNWIYCDNTSGIWVSNNYGVTWRNSNNTTFLRSIVSNGDFSRLTGVSGSTTNTYYSTDGGTNWSIYPGTVYLNSIDGKTDILVGVDGSDTVYISSNRGQTWDPTTTKPGSGLYLSLCCINSSGTVIYVCNSGNGKGIYYSLDGGATWNLYVMESYTWSISCSNDGTVCSVATAFSYGVPSFGIVYTTNSGSSWHNSPYLRVPTVDNWCCSVVSGNGNYISSSDYGLNYVYTLTLPFTPAVGTSLIAQFNVTIQTEIDLPLYNSFSNPVTFTVNWGDGITDSSLNHIYMENGIYTVTVVTTVNTFNVMGKFGDVWTNGADTLISVLYWSNSFIDFSFAFSGCSNLVLVPPSLPTSLTIMQNTFNGCQHFNQNLSSWNTSNVTKFQGLFNGASIFNNGNYSDNSSSSLSWDTHSVTDMSYMFYNTYFNQDVSTWDTHSVTDMGYMFNGALNFNKNLSLWDTHSVTNMLGMFGSSNFNNNGQPIPRNGNKWNTSSVTNMGGMFNNCYYFNQDVSTWYTQNVTDMNNMFSGTSFNNGGNPMPRNGNQWNTGSVRNMGGMFNSCGAFNQDVSTWDTHSVSNMSFMFNNCASFNNGGISLDTSGNNWNTGSVTDMSNMFNTSTTFNQPVSSWNTHLVSDMSYMFNGCTAFNQNLGPWNISNVTNMNQMLSNSGLSITNYDLTLIGWAGGNGFTPQINITIGVDQLLYDSSGATAHDILGVTTLPPTLSKFKVGSTYNWSFEGDRLSGPPPCYNKGTLILCENGYVPIENIVPGTLVQTYKHGFLEVKMIGKSRFINNPNNPFECMYKLEKFGDMTGDLIVTGGHGILKQTLTKNEISADYKWFNCLRRYSRIDGMYLQRAAYCPDFVKLKNNEEYEYYHIVLDGPSKLKRYGIWANGVLSESTFERDLLKLV